MNSPAPASCRPEEPAWSAGRWMFYLALAFALHLGLFYALHERAPQPPREITRAPVLKINPGIQAPADWEDPTLFALPHPRGFAGQTWLRLPAISFPPFRWSEPARLLELPVAQLGHWVLQLAATNQPPIAIPSLVPAPRLTVLPRPDVVRPARPSTVRLLDGLSDREWRNAPATLPYGPARDSLTNTTVQVLVDGRGTTISAILLRPGSGDAELDQTALRLARTARFSPNATPNANPAVGTLLFEWAPAPPPPAPTAPNP